MLKVKQGEVVLNGINISDEPMLNYVAMNSNGETVLLRPTAFEKFNKTCVIPEIDGDRVQFRAVWEGKYIELCRTKKEAQDIIDSYEQQQRECEHSKDYGAYDILDGIE